MVLLVTSNKNVAFCDNKRPQIKKTAGEGNGGLLLQGDCAAVMMR